MNETEFEIAPAPQRPRTATVIGLLTVTAAVLSYLGTFAMANALVAAKILDPWQRGQDPRYRWFAFSFALLMSLFLGVGAIARQMSARQVRQIDLMEEEV